MLLDELAKQRVKELCDLIAKEQNPSRFSTLLMELNELLDGASGGKKIDKESSDEGFSPSSSQPS